MSLAYLLSILVLYSCFYTLHIPILLIFHISHRSIRLIFLLSYHILSYVFTYVFMSFHILYFSYTFLFYLLSVLYLFISFSCIILCTFYILYSCTVHVLFSYTDSCHSRVSRINKICFLCSSYCRSQATAAQRSRVEHGDGFSSYE